jgi:hypothetical protein
MPSYDEAYIAGMQNAGIPMTGVNGIGQIVTAAEQQMRQYQDAKRKPNVLNIEESLNTPCSAQREVWDSMYGPGYYDTYVNLAARAATQTEGQLHAGEAEEAARVELVALDYNDRLYWDVERLA